MQGMAIFLFVPFLIFMYAGDGTIVDEDSDEGWSADHKKFCAFYKWKIYKNRFPVKVFASSPGCRIKGFHQIMDVRPKEDQSMH